LALADANREPGGRRRSGRGRRAGEELIDARVTRWFGLEISDHMRAAR
jgi:hypothetical protein